MRLSTITGWLRTEQWWNSKPPLMVAVAYFVLVSSSPLQPVDSALGAVVLLLAATFGLAGFGYLLNDIGDRDADRASGSANASLSIGLRWSMVGLGILATFAIVPWLWLPIRPLVVVLLLLEAALLAAYSLPPVRLKNRGPAGAATDAAYAYVIPLLVPLVIFADIADVRLSAWWAAIVCAWAFALGLRQILSHQLLDVASDERAGTVTIPIQFGWQPTLRLLDQRLLPLEAVLFAAFLLTLGAEAPIVPLAFAVHLTWVLVDQRRHSVLGPMPVSRLPAVTRVELLGTGVMTTFQVRWLPLLLLATLAQRDPAYLWLGALHLLLFETGLRRLVRYDLRTWHAARRTM